MADRKKTKRMKPIVAWAVGFHLFGGKECVIEQYRNGVPMLYATRLAALHDRARGDDFVVRVEIREASRG